MTDKDKADAQKQFIEAVNALTRAQQIKWYKNDFGDERADLSLSLVQLASEKGGAPTPILRASSAKPEKGSKPRETVTFQSVGETTRALLASIRGEPLAHMATSPKREPFSG